MEVANVDSAQENTAEAAVPTGIWKVLETQPRWLRSKSGGGSHREECACATKSKC